MSRGTMIVTTGGGSFQNVLQLYLPEGKGTRIREIIFK